MDILFVCAVDNNGNEYTHPAHERMVDHLNVDKMYVTKNIPGELIKKSVLGDLWLDIDYNSKRNQEYDFAILESPVSIIAAKKIRRNFDCPLLFVSSDWIFWPNVAHSFERNKNKAISYLMMKERELKAWNSERYLRSYVDGVISMSSLFDRMLSERVDIPSCVVNPSIQPDKYDKLSEIKYNPKSNDALFIGKNRDHKGVDIMVKAWSEADIGSTLKIAGSGHPDSYKKKDNVELLGYVSQDSLYDEMRSSGLYIHTARIDCNPVSALESMCAGLPTIVSNKTGTKDELEKIDDRLVTSTNITDIKNSIESLLSSDIDTRENLSQQCRKTGLKYDKARSQEEMDNALAEFEENLK